MWRKRWPLAPLFQAARWIRRNGDTLCSADLGAGLGLFGGVLVAALRWHSVREMAKDLYVIVGALGVALLGLALTALAILVGLLDVSYLLVLRQAHQVRGGLEYALRPYRVVSIVSAVTFVVSMMGLVLQKTTAWYVTAALMAVVAGLGTWALCGTVGLVRITTFHGLKKADLIDLQGELEQRLRKQRSKARPDN